MRIFEKIVIAFSVIGLVMQLFNVAGGRVFLVFGLTLLSLFYFLLTWLLLRDTQTKQYYLGISIPAGIVLSAACMAILYKLLFWEGAESMLTASLIFLVPLMIIVYLLHHKQKDVNESKERIYRKTLQRLVPFFIVAAALFFIPDRTIVEFKYRDDPEHARLYIRALENRENDQYWHELQEYELRKFLGTDTIKPKP